MNISGRGKYRVAHVKWTYFTAAVLEGYAVACDTEATPRTWTATGVVAHRDAFNLAQRPLFLVAPTKAGAFRWPIESFTVADNYFRARLGAPVSQPKGLPV